MVIVTHDCLITLINNKKHLDHLVINLCKSIFSSSFVRWRCWLTAFSSLGSECWWQRQTNQRTEAQCVHCHAMRRNTPGLPWEHQFSRQRQARNIAPNIGPQVELPGKNIKGIVSWLRGHLHHDVAIEDVGGEKHLPSGESPLTDGAGSNLISLSALSVLKSRASEYTSCFFDCMLWVERKALLLGKEPCLPAPSSTLTATYRLSTVTHL